MERWDASTSGTWAEIKRGRDGREYIRDGKRGGQKMEKNIGSCSFRVCKLSRKTAV